MDKRSSKEKGEFEAERFFSLFRKHTGAEGGWNIEREFKEATQGAATSHVAQRAIQLEQIHVVTTQVFLNEPFEV